MTNELLIERDQLRARVAALEAERDEAPPPSDWLRSQLVAVNKWCLELQGQLEVCEADRDRLRKNWEVAEADLAKTCTTGSWRDHYKKARERVAALEAERDRLLAQLEEKP